MQQFLQNVYGTETYLYTRLQFNCKKKINPKLSPGEIGQNMVRWRMPISTMDEGWTKDVMCSRIEDSLFISWKGQLHNKIFLQTDRQPVKSLHSRWLREREKRFLKILKLLHIVVAGRSYYWSSSQQSIKSRIFVGLLE